MNTNNLNIARACDAAGEECTMRGGATPASRETDLIEKAALRVGMKSLMNNGAASCVYSEGCEGVSQAHLIAFAREVALHCAAALSSPGAAQTREGAKPINLDVVRRWPAGFARRLEHVWRDTAGFIPEVKLGDVQRTLSEFGYRLEVYESAPSSQPVDGVQGGEG